MVPTTWDPYRRADDDELLGYLEASDDGTTPLTLFGVPLGEPTSVEDAMRVLDDRGLACLSEPWLLREDDGSETKVAITAAFPDRVQVVPAPYGFADPTATPVIVPAEDGARRLRPFA